MGVGQRSEKSHFLELLHYCLRQNLVPDDVERGKGGGGGEGVRGGGEKDI